MPIPVFLKALEVFIGKFGDLSCPVTGVVTCTQGPDALIRLVLEMASHPPSRAALELRDVEALTASFLERFEGEKHTRAVELLDLARTSYRLRDNDNIHLARIEAQKLAAVEEGKRRIALHGRARLTIPWWKRSHDSAPTVGPETETVDPGSAPWQLISRCSPDSSWGSRQVPEFRAAWQGSSWGRPIWESFDRAKSWCVTLSIRI